jgi:hypothetical protein
VRHERVHPTANPRGRQPHGGDAEAARHGAQQDGRGDHRRHLARARVPDGLRSGGARVAPHDRAGDPPAEEATGTTVDGIVGDPDPFTAVQQALKETPYDEIIISTLPARVSRWLKRDLPQRVERLGVPVTVVTAPPAAGMMGESMVPQTP